MVRKRCDTVYLKSKGLKTGQIREWTGCNIKTIRAHLHLYKDGGIEALKRRPYRPKTSLLNTNTRIGGKSLLPYDAFFLILPADEKSVPTHAGFVGVFLPDRL